MILLSWDPIKDTFQNLCFSFLPHRLSRVKNYQYLQLKSKTKISRIMMRVRVVEKTVSLLPPPSLDHVINTHLSG